MHARLTKRIGSILLAGGLLVGVAAAASAHPGNGHGGGNGHANTNASTHGNAHHVANTRMRFHLDDHNVAVGDPVTGTVRLFTKADHHWGPFAGVTLSVRVDGTEVGTVVTGTDGSAPVSYSGASEGGHVMRVVYVGDDTHRRRQRAQGFFVGTDPTATPTATAEPTDTPTDEPTDEPTDAPTDAPTSG